uniref:Caspase-3 n=1 Tax=Globodera rostochiensis TaxID=31243 RepID=A0A914HRG7_GLORO
MDLGKTSDNSKKVEKQLNEMRARRPCRIWATAIMSRQNQIVWLIVRTISLCVHWVVICRLSNMSGKRCKKHEDRARTSRATTSRHEEEQEDNDGVSVDADILKELKRGILEPFLLMKKVIRRQPALVSYAMKNKDLVYQNFTSPRGLAIVINNHTFLDNHKRIGTNIDRENITNLLQQLDYTVQNFDDLTAAQMISQMRRFGRHDHGPFSSTFVVLLSHGEENIVYGVDGCPVDLYELFECLSATNCPTLAGKAKIFVIQSCRGGRVDNGVYVNEPQRNRTTTNTTRTNRGRSRDVSPKRRNDSVARRLVPNNADRLVAFSSLPKHASMRDHRMGSWFIQAFCKLTRQHAFDLDIIEILTRVRSLVAQMHVSRQIRFLQVPQNEDALLKKFYFFPASDHLHHRDNTDYNSGVFIDAVPITSTANGKALTTQKGI